MLTCQVLLLSVFVLLAGADSAPSSVHLHVLVVLDLLCIFKMPKMLDIHSPFCPYVHVGLTSWLLITTLKRKLKKKIKNQQICQRLYLKDMYLNTLKK